MPSPVYALFAEAMIERKQILCDYDGLPRELCSILLGHSDRREVALAYQFAGGGKSPLPSRGQWKCLFLSKVRVARLRVGARYAGASHERPQSCVKLVDLDANPQSAYAPRRRIPSRPRPHKRRD